MAAGRPRASAARAVRSRRLLLPAAAALTVCFRGVAFLALPASSASDPRLAIQWLPNGRNGVHNRVTALALGDGEEAEEEGRDRELASAEVSGEPSVGQQFTGRVVRVMESGVMVDIGSARDGLVPRSKLQDGPTERVADVVQVGDTVTVWVSESNSDKLVLSMSQKKIFGPQPQRRSDFASFEGIGSSEWLPGTVVRVGTFGAFIIVSTDSGKQAQGLLHRSEFASGVQVSVGDIVKVRMLSVDAGAERMSLSMKPEVAEVPADFAAFEGINSSEWLPGEVRSVANFGAFVLARTDSGKQAQGLLHRSEFDDGGTQLYVGDSVQIRVLRVDADTKKMALSMRPASAAGDQSRPRPRNELQDVSAFEEVDAKAWLEGTVEAVVDFGAFIRVRPPAGEPSQAVVGLCHISQMKDGGKVSEGDSVEVRVTKVDIPGKKLSLSMQTVRSNIMRDVSAFEGISDTVWLQGTVKGMANFGAFIEVQPPSDGPSIQGLVRNKEIREGTLDPAEELELEQEVRVRVTKVDMAAGTLDLSMRPADVPE